MRKLLDRSPIDGFVLSIFLAVVVAALFPARGTFADVMDWVVVGLIALGLALVFFRKVLMYPVNSWR